MPYSTAVKRLVRRLCGKNGYETLVTIRRARALRRSEKADDLRRTALYRTWIRPGDLVFDIGANLGNRTRVFSGLGARVVAVEPQPHCRSALRWQFLFDRRVAIVGAAAGRDTQPRELIQFDTDVLSSMNPQWIEAVGQSERFGQLNTVRKIVVPCVTIDGLIERRGRPVFVKIDVEGFEAEVLAGLSQPAGTLSFEFTPELPEVAIACIDRLNTLGYRKFQFSPGESMQLDPARIDADAMRARIRTAGVGSEFGDIYALDPRRPE